MSQFIETIHLQDGVLKQLDYHQKRLRETFDYFFPEEDEIDLRSLFKGYSLPAEGRFRCTVRYGRSVESLDVVEYKPRKISCLRVVSIEEIDYSWKYADREIFENLKEATGENEDIIIVRNGHVTDSSYANLIFSDGRRWYTPAHPLLKGTKRQKLLDEGVIIERDIRINDLKKYRVCSLINAMLDPGEVEVDIRKIFS